MDRVIRVTGKGKLSIKPDTTCVLMTVEGREAEYSDALQKAAEAAEQIRSIIISLGFAAEELKTNSLDVEPEYEGYQDADHTWKNRFVGYRYHHRLQLQFPVNNELLGKLLYQLAHCEVKVELSLEYIIADQEKCKNELLALAVRDSKEKAKVLADAAGVTLGEIRLLDYSWAELELVSRPVNRMAPAVMCMKAEDSASYAVDINPNDINVEDTVTVEWGIC